jgi:hypothetical protein
MVMTQAVSEILDKVEQLSVAERRELRLAIAERVSMTDDLTEDDFGALAAASFRQLDAEEDAARA